MTSPDYQRPYAHHTSANQGLRGRDRVDPKPTVIIGVSTVAKAFNQRVIETMARINRRKLMLSAATAGRHGPGRRGCPSRS